MDYEQKYKNALEWARQVMEGKTGFIRKEVEEVFPELKENEDEKIRKKLINFVENWKNRDYNSSFDDFPIFTSNNDECDRILAWLEKQGEKNIGRSEEDEYLLEETIQHLEELIRIERVKNCRVDVQYYQRDIDWLKSLKQRLGGGE